MIKFWPPIEVELIDTGLPALMIGFHPQDDSNNNDWVLLVFEDGTLGWKKRGVVKTNWRFDWNQGLWIDTKEIDATQDDPFDGSESVSGTVPELDEFGEGDPLDEEGRQTAGDPGDVDAGEGK